MATELQPIDAATVERVLLHGDLSKLPPAQKVAFYYKVCDTVGLNPLTQPFAYLVLNGKEILYAKRDATEQLRKLHKVSIEIRSREVVEGTYVVTARATLPDGRFDENIGAVPIEGLRGEARSNALMKGETKAKRRVTLSICGLGMLDESEVESLPPAASLAPEPVPPAELPPSPSVPPDSAPDTLPPNAVYILSVTNKPTKNPSITRTTVHFSDGESLTTINDWLMSLADELRKEQAPVYKKSKQSKYGPELVALKRADEPELPIAPELT